MTQMLMSFGEWRRERRYGPHPARDALVAAAMCLGSVATVYVLIGLLERLALRSAG